MGRPIAVDVAALGGPGSVRGLGRATRAVLAANHLLENSVSEVDPGWTTSRLGELVALGRRRKLVNGLGGSVDIYHAPHTNACVYNAMVPTVTSILDTIPLDLVGHRRSGVKTRVMFGLARRSTMVTTLSGHAADRIRALLDVPASRIVVAPLPIGQEFRRRTAAEVLACRERHGVPPSYAIAQADFRAHDSRKRAEWLDLLGPLLNRFGIQLVVYGPGSDAQLGRGFTGVGWVTDSDVAALLSGALAFIGTSAYEGQGLPVLEAMACGCPVVAMNNTAVTEMAQDASILIGEDEVDPITALAESVVRLAADDLLATELGERGRNRAADFSMARFAEAISFTYQQARKASR